MSKVVHDYKGRNIYHLIKDNKRFEFKVTSFWIERFNDSAPLAIGVEVVTLNPTVLLPLKLKDNRVEFVVYVDESETDDLQDLLKTAFSTLAIVLWGKDQVVTFMATEAMHLNNSLLKTPTTRWRATRLFSTPLLLKDIRSRLDLVPDNLPNKTGEVVISSKNMQGQFLSVTRQLSDFEEKMDTPFNRITLQRTMESFGGIVVP